MKKTPLHHRRAPRGVAMLAVLVALLLLSILASGFFLQARDSSTLSNISMTQGIALTNAELGMQEAIRRIRAAQIDPAGIGTCTTAQVDANACPTAFNSGIISGPTTNPMAGGGILYQFIVYQRPPFVDPGQPTNRYVVRATGFFGQNINSPALVTSILEAEVDMGRGTRTTCTGGYECI